MHLSNRPLLRARTWRIAVAAVLVFATSSVTASATGSTPTVAPTFFGMHAGWAPYTMVTPSWPTAAYRLHDVGTAWCTLNPAPGVYDWAALDAWFAQATKTHADLLYAFSYPPRWATSYADPSKPACSAYGDAAAAAVPSDAAWVAFVTALVHHSAGRIKAYEMWNESNWYLFWGGTAQQLAHLTDLAAPVIRSGAPGASVVTPSVVPEGATWLQGYLTSVNRKNVDVVAFHGYPPAQYGPEGLPYQVGLVRQAMAATGYSGYRLWNTEGGWGPDSQYGSAFTPAFQRAYVARLELLNAALGVERFYWYRFEPGWGGLSDASGKAGPGGVAMQQVQAWLTGATPTGPCQQQGAVWTCDIKRGSSLVRVVWAPSGSGSYTVPTTFRSVLTLGGLRSSAKRLQPVGAEPVLLQQ